MMKRSFLVLGVLAVAGCWDVEFDVDTNLDIDVKVTMGKLSAECAGTDPLVTYTPGDGVCRIEIKEWRGTLVDMAVVRAKVEQKVIENGEDPKDIPVSITGIKLSKKDIRLLDGNGANVTPASVELFDATIDLDGERLLTFEGAQLTQLLLGEAVAIFTDAQVKKLNAAYKASAPVAASGRVTLVVRNELMQELARHEGLNLNVKFLMDVGASGSKEAF